MTDKELNQIEKSPKLTDIPTLIAMVRGTSNQLAKVRQMLHLVLHEMPVTKDLLRKLIAETQVDAVRAWTQLDRKVQEEHAAGALLVIAEIERRAGLALTPPAHSAVLLQLAADLRGDLKETLDVAKPGA